MCSFQKESSDICCGFESKAVSLPMNCCLNQGNWHRKFVLCSSKGHHLVKAQIRAIFETQKIRLGVFLKNLGQL
jgi:hypothetical protein